MASSYEGENSMMKDKRTKDITLVSGTIEGWLWAVRLRMLSSGLFSARGTYNYQNQAERYIKDKDKSRIRITDKQWCYRNIPSSIVWNTEIHHNWGDNGTMYLLTKGEHILRHRREKDEKQRKG